MAGSLAPYVRRRPHRRPTPHRAHDAHRHRSAPTRRSSSCAAKEDDADGARPAHRGHRRHGRRLHLRPGLRAARRGRRRRRRSTTGGLPVLIPADSIDTLRGATLDLPVGRRPGRPRAAQPEPSRPALGRAPRAHRRPVAEKVQPAARPADQPGARRPRRLRRARGASRATSPTCSWAAAARAAPCRRMTLREGIAAAIMATCPRSPTSSTSPTTTPARTPSTPVGSSPPASGCTAPV